MPHVWTGNGSLTSVHDEDVEPGDEFAATDAELSAFGDVIEKVEPEEITCAEGDCSRTVAEVGETCWQHS